MTPFWMTDHHGADRLVLMRLVHLNDRDICQGILLDDRALTALLTATVDDLFPDARILPMKDADPPHPDRHDDGPAV